MKYLAITLALVGAAMVAHAQNTIPDLRGTWTGKDKSIIYGNNPHHPGTQTIDSPPRVQDFEFTFVIDGQEGRLLWGHSLSKAAVTNEPFAWTFAADGKTIIGADTDGYYNISVVSPDKMELCYAHNSLSPTKSIVASCVMMARDKK